MVKEVEGVAGNLVCVEERGGVSTHEVGLVVDPMGVRKRKRRVEEGLYNTKEKSREIVFGG